jgi:hypothetical protein
MAWPTFTEAYRIEADTCDHYLEAKLMNLSVGKQVSEGELHAKKDDALKSSGPCSCSCICWGRVAVASLEGFEIGYSNPRITC